MVGGGEQNVFYNYYSIKWRGNLFYGSISGLTTCYLFLRINFQTEFNSADDGAPAGDDDGHDDGERYNLYQHKPTRHVASINAMHMSFSKGINKIY